MENSNEEKEVKSEKKKSKEKKQLNVKLSTAIAIIVATIILIGISVYACVKIIPEKRWLHEQQIMESHQSNPFDRMPIKAAKPIIYLYPTTENNVSVQLGKRDKITCSYPKYTTGWNVLAQPNGNLRDLDTGKNLYALYYESENDVEFKIEKDGFVVKGEDSTSFLEEKLAILGLSDREAEEFIVYWLPKLEANKYNYIRFATKEEIDANMPLAITPTPDTTIRVLMEYKGLDNPIQVEEQKLTKVDRRGFVAVEWGGTELK